MSLLGGVTRRSLENPSVPLTASSLVDLFSGPRSDAGVAVTEQRVLGLPAYYRALAVTAGTLGSLPVKVYRKGTRQRVLTPTVLTKPKANPRQTTVEWRVTTFLHLFAWGNAFSRKIRDGAGMVTEVWPIHPANVSIDYVDPTSADPAGKVFIVRNAKGQEQRLTSREVLHLPYMSMDGVSGVRPMEAFRQSLGLAVASDDAAAKFYANGSKLSGILKTQVKLEQPTADRLKARWKQMTGGVANAGEIAVLDAGAEFQPVSIPPVDAQLLESRKWSVDEIGRMVGVPPHVIGNVAGSTSWGTGIEQQVLGWVKFTLQAPITMTEERWTDEILPGPWYAEHSLEGLLRGDSASRAAFHHQAIIDGWRNRNEVRQIENEEPAEGLDGFLVPSNMALIGDDGTPVALTSDGLAGSDDPADSVG